MENVTPIRQADGTSSGKIEHTPRPHNIEAEQALLGILLVDPSAYGKISGIVEETHFFDPVHGYIFNLIGQKANAGRIATPITLAPTIEGHPGIVELGGKEYLVRLANSAISIHACQDYAEQIRDLSMRRQLMDLGQHIVEDSRSVDPARSAKDLIEETERKLYSLGENGKSDGAFGDFVTALCGAVAVARRAAESKRKIAGLPTGLRAIDQETGGLHDSDLIILAGRPAMGKTALATNIAFHIASTFRKEGTTAEGLAVSRSGGMVGFLFPGNVLGSACTTSAVRILRNFLHQHS